MPASITIKELHATTGEHVRRAGLARSPIVITDRGRPIAVIANLTRLQRRRRKRTILPEYEALMARKPGHDMIDALTAVRGDR